MPKLFDDTKYTKDANEERISLIQGRKVNLNRLEQTNVVRIFVSSTFSDMRVERNTLLEKAYPDLRSFCQKLGLDFQAMDMRWGIQDSAMIDHSICELCLNEIKTCKRLSIGPFFVAFLGNRYGYRPVPSTISVQNFDKFEVIANEKGYTSSNLLTKWYQKDANAVPVHYVLQPITSEYPHFNDDDVKYEKERNIQRQKWSDTSQQLADVIRKCASEARRRKLLVKIKGEHFFESVTELEIKEGLFSSAGSATYLYEREISDLQHNISDTAARNFVDLSGNTEVDLEAQNLLNNLKAEVTKLGQTKGNSSLVKTYKVKWVAGKGITEKSKSHSAYLTKFCHDFVTDFKTAISQAVSNSGKQEEKAAEKSDLLFDEVIHHAAFAQTKLKSFCGRSQLIETILSKLDGDTSSHPVVAFGESGRGKTALMAKLVDSRRNMSSNESLVYRFLGTSPHSSNIHSVLQSITLQICELIPTPPPLYHELQNFTSLVMKFNEVLATASAVISRGDTQTHLGEKLNIFLDSLDQLSELDGAHRLNWLPKHLPPHVHIILSTLPDPNLGILDTLHRTLPSSNFTEVTDLDRETGCEILNTWLKDSGRTLSQPQHDFVMDAFVKSPQPLYLKLAFDEARLWKSYTDVSSLYLGKSAKEAISLFFKRLENTHGELFVARSIGYLVASRNGLGEAELNDLLSLDNEVLDCSYRHWSPPSHNVVRIPTLLWTRLRNDLGADIVERQSTGYTVLALYHRQFIEVAWQRYLGSDVKEKVHQNIAEYFLGKWSDGKKKSLKLNIWKNKEMKANRNVATQPLKFTAKIFNFRKLDELPFQLLSAGMWQELNDVVVSSADWLTHKIEAFSIKEMLQDYDMILSKKPDTEITLIRNALKLAKPTLEFPGKVTNHVCSEMIGRLAYFTKDFPRLVGKLVTESEQLLKRMNKMCLIPLCGSFPPPGGPLRTTLTGFSKSVTCMEVSCDASALFAGSRDGTIMIWELGVDEVLHTIHLHKDTVLCFAIAGLRLASSSADNTLQVLNWDTGSIVASMVEDHTEHTYHCNLALNDDGTILVSACGKQINIWGVSSSSIQHSIKESNYLSCNILLCGQAVIAGYKNGAIMSWSLETGNTMYDTTTGNNGTKNENSGIFSVANFLIQDKLMSLFNNGKVDLYNSSSGVLISSYDVDTNVEMSACAGGYVAFSCGKEIHVWKIEGQELKKTSVLQHHHDSVSTLNFNKTGDILVSGGRDHTLLCWTIGKDGITLADNMSGMGAPVDHVVLSGNIVASSSKNVFYVKLWNLNRTKVVKDPPSFPFQLGNHVISSCGKYICYFYEDLIIHDLELKSNVKVMRAGKSEITCMKFTPDSCYIVCATVKGDLELVHCVDHQVMQTTSISNSSVSLLALSSDGSQLLAVTGNGDMETLHFMKTEGFEPVMECLTCSIGIEDAVTAVSLSPENSGYITAFIGVNSGIISVVSVHLAASSSPKVTLQVILKEHKSKVTNLTLSSDRQMLFSGSEGATRRIWKFKSGEWKLHQEMLFDSLLNTGVTCSAFISDSYVITGSQERSIKVWNTNTGELVASQYVYATVTDIVAVNDANIILTTDFGCIIQNYLLIPRVPVGDRPENSSLGNVAPSSQNKTLKIRSSTCAVV